MAKALVTTPKKAPPPPTFAETLVNAIDQLQFLDRIDDDAEARLFAGLKRMARAIGLNQVRVLEPRMWESAPKDGTVFDLYGRYYDPNADKFRFVRFADTYWHADKALPDGGRWAGIFANFSASVRPLYWVPTLSSDEIAELCTR